MFFGRIMAGARSGPMAKLPDDPPELRFDGYSVGRWEETPWSSESTGFNDKLWLTYTAIPTARRCT
jgi:hypothetical protein